MRDEPLGSPTKGSHISSDETEGVEEISAMLSMIDFSTIHMKVHDKISIDDCVLPQDSALTRSVHLAGLQDRQSIEQIGRQFGIHPLLVEDILNPRHRPKLDAESDQFCLILREFRLIPSLQMESEQVSIVVGSGFVLSFQESNVDLFSDIKLRLSNPKSRVRRSKSDFLGYLLIDALIDRYLTIMDAFDDRIQTLEDTSESWDRMTLNEIYRLRYLMESCRELSALSERPFRDLYEASLKLSLKRLVPT
ncbi:MAG: hypothetical protein JSW61_08320 [Candidatus Thorarchaeota archaeon]|nr:MAG: hypothetical protein JSW61_08320 [Candidatus Thorarchaeota archaeon]